MSFGPIVLQNVGDTFTKPAQILAVVWEGATQAGYTAELRCPKTGRLFWPGRTGDTNTYLGINLGVEGMSAPYGFVAAVLQAGRLVVYLREN